MTTGHWNPGYGNIVTRFRRSKSAGVLPGSLIPGQLMKDRQDCGLGPETLDDIRRRAREVWSRPDIYQTTYNDHYEEKGPLLDESPHTRPTSAQRRNKPHPPMVFLNCRLHTVPGFFNPDATLGKDMYQIDGVTGGAEQYGRSLMRSKYSARPSTAAVAQYNRDEDLDVIADPRQRQATEAWMKLANDQDRQNLRDELKFMGSTRLIDMEEDEYEAPEPLPSLHRYLKPAGTDEQARLAEMYRRHREATHQRPKSVSVSTMRKHDIQKMRNVPAPRYSSKRGDFLMHPEWRPTIPHHRLNGLSSVDVPYMPGRR